MSSKHCFPTADGVEYFTIEGVPGQYFACPRGLGRFAVAHCVRMYGEAISGWSRAERVTCRGCAAGACHAGVHAESRFALTRTCSRCHRKASRLIRASICLSCYNREREVLIWRNRKGGPPKFCKPIGAVQLQVATPEAVRVEVVERVASRLEAVIAVLRRSPDAAIGWSAPHV